MPAITTSKLAELTAQGQLLSDLLDQKRKENKDLKDQVEQLEQLCNELFNHVCAEQLGARVNMAQFVELSERMGDLGLLED